MIELATIIQTYLLTEEMAGRAPKTMEEKRNQLKRLVTFLGTRDLNSQTAFQYVMHLKTKKRPYKNNSLLFEITMLKTFEKFCLEQGYISQRFTNLLKNPKKEIMKDFIYFDPELIDRAIVAGTEPTPYVRRGEPGDNARNAYRKKETREALKLVSRRALRITEVLRLRGSDLNFQSPTPQFRIAPIKGHKETWVDIPSDMVTELWNRRLKDRVFETTESLCNISLRRGWKKIGMKGHIHNHILRHQQATHLLKQGMAMDKLQKFMRHKSIKVTIDTYTHLDNSDIDPFVQAADPRTRKLLNYADQVAYVQGVLDRLRLESEKVGVEIVKKDGEFVFRMVAT